MPFGQQDEVCRKSSFIFWKSASLALPAPCFQPYGKYNLSYDCVTPCPQNCGDCSRSSNPGSHMVLAGSETLMPLRWQVPSGVRLLLGVGGGGTKDPLSLLNPEPALSLPGPSVHAKALQV